MRTVLIRVLGLLLPLLLTVWAVHLCERAFYRSVGASLIDVPDIEGRLLPSSGPPIRGLLEPPADS
jgi:hypothetical protein